MKKFLAVILILCVITAVGLAESADYSTYSEDELFAVRKVVDEEFIRRLISSPSYLPKGYYEVGEDIPIGSYLLISAKDGPGYYEIFEGRPNSDNSIEEHNFSDEYLSAMRIKLRENDYIYLGGPTYIIPYEIKM